MLLVIVGFLLGLVAGISVYITIKINQLKQLSAECMKYKEEQEKAVRGLESLHNATVSKYTQVSADLANLKAEVSGIKMTGPSYGVKRKV